jgi:hypothetical protein
MMMTGVSGKSTLVLELILGMIVTRLSIFALSTVGVIAWALPLSSVTSRVLKIPHYQEAHRCGNRDQQSNHPREHR